MLAAGSLLPPKRFTRRDCAAALIRVYTSVYIYVRVHKRKRWGFLGKIIVQLTTVMGRCQPVVVVVRVVIVYKFYEYISSGCEFRSFLYVVKF